MARRPSTAALVGTLLGAAACVALVVTGVLVVPEAPDTRDESAAFLDAWERYRTATFVMDQSFTRTMPDGRTLEGGRYEAQRPPDRIVRQFGGIDGRIDDREVLCSTDPTGGYRCITGTRVLPPYAEEVAGSRRAFEAMFAGERPIYRVRPGDQPGCFRFEPGRYVPDAEYGVEATFCFDTETGALRRVERRLESGVVEVTEAVVLRAAVSDADFTLEQDPGDLIGFAPGGVAIGGGTTTTTPTP